MKEILLELPNLPLTRSQRIWGAAADYEILVTHFAGKLTADAALDPAGLVAVAIAHAFALFVGVSMAANISGGHLNPAVTLGLAVGGNITILTGLFYWVAQCLGSTIACLLLKFVTHGKVTRIWNVLPQKI